jgi:hypothetical protein
MNQPDAQKAPNYVTCPCQHCSGKIEFDANQIDVTGAAGNTLTGQTIACPHCGLDTILFVPQPPKQELKPAADHKSISLPKISNPSSPQNIVKSWVSRHKGWSIIIAFFLLCGFTGNTIDLLNEGTGVLTSVVEGCLRSTFGFALIAALLFIYFLPYYFARKHGKKNKEAIFILNLFLGWTFVGWVVAAVWAYTKDDK